MIRAMAASPLASRATRLPCSDRPDVSPVESDGDMVLPSVPDAVPPTSTAHRPRLVEALALPGEMSAAAPLRVMGSSPQAKTREGLRERPEPGPKMG